VLVEAKWWGCYGEAVLVSDLENAVVKELAELPPDLSILVVFNSGDVDEVANVDANAIIFQILKLVCIVQVYETDLSSSASFSSLLFVLEDLVTIGLVTVVGFLLDDVCIGNESESSS
jgi:hypothetical protein